MNYPNPISLRLSDEQRDALDALCRREGGRVPTRNEMMRRLIDRAASDANARDRKIVK